MDNRTTNGLFTWQNKRSGERHIISRFDRILFLESALVGGGELRATVLSIAGSDHWPISLEWGQLGEFVKCPFRFKKFWFQHPNFHGLMEEWWEGFPTIEGPCMYVIQQKLKYIKDCVKKWNKESFGHITQEK